MDGKIPPGGRYFWRAAALVLLLITACSLPFFRPPTPGPPTLTPTETPTPTLTETPTPTLTPYPVEGTDWSGVVTIVINDAGCFIKEGVNSFQDTITIHFTFKAHPKTLQGTGSGTHQPVFNLPPTPDPLLSTRCPNFEVTVGGTHEANEFSLLFFPSKEGGCGGNIYSGVILALFANTQFKIPILPGATSTGSGDVPVDCNPPITYHYMMTIQQNP